MELQAGLSIAVTCLLLGRNVSGHGGKSYSSQEKSDKGSSGTWEVHNFPDPQVDVLRCGRQGTASFVCDPDNVLSENEADRIDKLIQEVENQTHCLCAAHGECDTNQGGLKLAVAVIAKLAVPLGIERSRAHIKKELVRFGDELNNHMWNYGFCGDNAVVVLSKDDKMIHTSIGEATRSHVHGECVDQGEHNTNADMNKRLYADAISKTITFYLHVIESGTTCEKSRSWVFIVTIVVPAVVFIIMYLVVRKLLLVLKDSEDSVREGDSYHEASIGEGRPHFHTEFFYESCKSRDGKRAAVGGDCKHSERMIELRELTVLNECGNNSGEDDRAGDYDGRCGCEKTLSPPCSEKQDGDKMHFIFNASTEEMDKVHTAHALESSTETMHSRNQDSCQTVSVVKSKTTEAVIEQGARA